MCRKRAYSKREAREMRNLREKDVGKGSLRVYECPNCSRWHLTSKNPGKEKRGK